MEKRFTSREDGIDFIMAALPCTQLTAYAIWPLARLDGFIRIDPATKEYVLPDSDMLTDYAERVFGLTNEEK